MQASSSQLYDLQPPVVHNIYYHLDYSLIEVSQNLGQNSRTRFSFTVETGVYSYSLSAYARLNALHVPSRYTFHHVHVKLFLPDVTICLSLIVWLRETIKDNCGFGSIVCGVGSIVCGVKMRKIAS